MRKATPKGAALTIIPARSRAVGPVLELEERAHELAAAARSKNTLRAYASDWRDFSAFCQAHGLEPLPAGPATVALYLSDLAPRLKTSTIQRRLSAIAQAHKLAGHASPTENGQVREVAKGLRRTKGTAKTGKAPLSVEDLRRMSRALPDSPIGTRDRALLLLGYVGALRRSELVALNVGDCKVTRDGLVLTIRRSKTDQEGAGDRVALPYGSHVETCPVRAFEAWREAAALERGPVFRSVNRHAQIGSARLSDRAVALVVKRSAERVGLDVEDLAGHSLRSGFITAAAEAGVPERRIMDQSRHRSIAIMRGYVRSASLFRENAAAAIGL